MINTLSFLVHFLFTLLFTFAILFDVKASKKNFFALKLLSSFWNVQAWQYRLFTFILVHIFFFCVHLHIGSFLSTAFCDHGPFILITNHWFQRFGSNQFCLDLLFILNHITKKVWNIYILGFFITCKCKNNQAFEQGFVFIDLEYSF